MALGAIFGYSYIVFGIDLALAGGISLTLVVGISLTWIGEV